MTRWLGLDLLFAWIVKQFLYLVVRTQVQPDNVETLQIDLEKPVCYVDDRDECPGKGDRLQGGDILWYDLPEKKDQKGHDENGIQKRVVGKNAAG